MTSNRDKDSYNKGDTSNRGFASMVEAKQRAAGRCMSAARRMSLTRKKRARPGANAGKPSAGIVSTCRILAAKAAKAVMAGRMRTTSRPAVKATEVTEAVPDQRPIPVAAAPCKIPKLTGKAIRTGKTMLQEKGGSRTFLFPPPRPGKITIRTTVIALVPVKSETRERIAPEGDAWFALR